MTDKQARFVEEYLIDCNATAAAKRAGYATSTAEKQAQLWIGKTREESQYPEMFDALAARREELRKATQVSQERVIEEYRRIAFSDIRDLFTWDEERACYVPSDNLTDEQAAVVQSIKAKTTRTRRGRGEEAETEERIELEMKTYDKLRALNDLAKHLGMFGPDGSKSNPLHVAYEVVIPTAGETTGEAEPSEDGDGD